MEKINSSCASPIPLTEIESVLAWVDSFKLSRPTKKINRDFSDAVLLAEILSVNYPKLVEMHNYPPRNSHALKVNNWMTLNRKVLKKLRLNLSADVIDQLAKCAPGVIERVLVMVRDKIRQDEDNMVKNKDAEQNVSSGGSYYEACGDDENILVVPVKLRVNGVLETVQQKVIKHETYLALKEELKDANDAADLLKQKVEHLEKLLMLKDERIEELQAQLARKQARRKAFEDIQNSPTPCLDNSAPPSPRISDLFTTASGTSLKFAESIRKVQKLGESKIPILITSPTHSSSEPLTNAAEETVKLDNIKSDVFSEAVTIEDKNSDGFQDMEEIEPIENIVTVGQTIQKEIKEIVCSDPDGKVVD